LLELELFISFCHQYLSVLHNYLDDLTKLFPDPYLAKFSDKQNRSFRVAERTHYQISHVLEILSVNFLVLVFSKNGLARSSSCFVKMGLYEAAEFGCELNDLFLQCSKNDKLLGVARGHWTINEDDVTMSFVSRDTLSFLGCLCTFLLWTVRYTYVREAWVYVKIASGDRVAWDWPL